MGCDSIGVNVYTEWGPLREVIVGSSLNFNIDRYDKAFKYLYFDNIKRAIKNKVYDEDFFYRIDKRYTIERQYDLDNFADKLNELGVKVRRPKRLTKPAVVKTPYFKGMVNAVDSPRDMFLCIGNTIIETSPTNRNRYFEGMMLRHIFTDYFREGAKWILAPRTRLVYDSIDMQDWEKITALSSLEKIEKRLDICFDAANCLKFGKDILMNVGNRNDELGAFWLQRHLGDEFRVHKVRITDCHIDGTIMPLKPGILLVNPNMKGRLHTLPKPLQKWKTIWALDKPKSFNYPFDHVQLASFTGMSMNVLSIDEKTVIARKEDVYLKKKLEKEGFDVLAMQLRHCELFGGSFHCSTLDVRRDENCKDYWIQ